MLGGRQFIGVSYWAIALLFCSLQFTSISARAENIYAFLPLSENEHFLFLKANGTSQIQIEKHDTLEKGSLTSNLAGRRSGQFRHGQTLYLHKVKLQSKFVYELSSLASENISSEAAINGITQKADIIYISHKDGIDEISAPALKKAISEGTDTQLEIIHFQKLPNATSVVFLTKAFKDNLKLTSQWDAKTNTSMLTLFIEDGTQINKWTLNVPILSLAISEGTLTSPRVKLFAAGENAGIHVFEIDLTESSVHANFIKRTNTISPVEGEKFTAVFTEKDKLHYITSTQTDFFLHASDMDKMVAKAHALHKKKITEAMDLPFELEHESKAFLNGLIASIPFDADRLVDVMGFDLKENLNDQLQKHDLLDSITTEERSELESMFNKYRITGEVTGDALMIASIFTKAAQIRKFKRLKTQSNIAEMNALRAGLGIAESGAMQVSTGKKWLSSWSASELAIAKTSGLIAQMEKLKAMQASGKVLSSADVLGIITEMEKIKLTVLNTKGIAKLKGPLLHVKEFAKPYFSPLERSLSRLGLASPKLAKLEKLTHAKLAGLMTKMHPADLSKIFSGQTLLNWNRLQRLGAMEQLSEFQKIEKFYLTMKVKAGVLKGFKKFQSGNSWKLTLSPATKNVLINTQISTGLSSYAELTALTQEAVQLSKVLNRSEQLYVLERVLQLEQMGEGLSNLEKLEKLKLMVKAGWTANTGKSALPAAWTAAELTDKRAKLLDTIDSIYDYEQLQSSGFLARTFQNGKLAETLAFTAISDAMNLGTEYVFRAYDGRPFLAPGVVHNMVFNTYIMLPIFATRGLRLSPNGKLFLLVVNAVSTGYMSQKITRWGGAAFDSQYTIDKFYKDYDNFKASDLLPPPQMPFAELPGYVMRDIFQHRDPHFDGPRAVFDSGWTMFLSTPRGIGASWLSGNMAGRATFEGSGWAMAGLREGVRASPVLANELAGAIAYPPLYGAFFEDSTFKLLVLDAKLEVIDPWESEGWSNSKPTLQFTLQIASSTSPQDLTFELHKGTDSDQVYDVKLEAESWEKESEQLYKVTWSKEVSYESEPSHYSIKNIRTANDSREVGNPFEFWKGKTEEEGKNLFIPISYQTTVQQKDLFVEGLLKALLSLSKEASNAFMDDKKYFAAGIVMLIGRFLEPIKDEFVIANESQSLALDALKEAVKITKSTNFSDYPTTKEAIDLLSNYLHQLSFQIFPKGMISFRKTLPDGQSLETASSQRSWIDFQVHKQLDVVTEDILEETRSTWVILDEGGKNDWSTLQTYKGFGYGLAQIYQWYRYQFQSDLQDTADEYKEVSKQLEGIENFGDELNTSWTNSLGWSDSYLRDLAQKFKILKEVLEEATKR